MSRRSAHLDAIALLVVVATVATLGWSTATGRAEIGRESLQVPGALPSPGSTEDVIARTRILLGRPGLPTRPEPTSAQPTRIEVRCPQPWEGLSDSQLEAFLRGFCVLPFVQHGRPHGTRIEEVAPGSILYRKGFRSEDIILSFNRHPLNGPDDFCALATEITHGPVDFLVKRRGRLFHLHVARP